MKLPRLSACCCGCSLRTGSVTIGLFFGFWEILEMISYSLLANKELRNSREDTASTQEAFLITGATIAALLVLANVLLLVGIYKKRSSYLLPWLVVYAVITGLSLLVFWLSSYGIFITAPFLEAIGILVLSLFKAALVIYCILVVHSYNCELTDKPITQPQYPVYPPSPPPYTPTSPWGTPTSPWGTPASPQWPGAPATFVNEEKRPVDNENH